MPKLVIGMRANQGFTLIEIMVVIVIIGITVGFALLSFGDFGKSRQVMMAADQFANTIRLAQQQAVLESSTLGIMLKNNNYQIYRFSPPANWNPISKKGIFGPQHFPEHAVLQLTTNNQPKSTAPQIVINSSGDMTAFTLTFSTKDKQSIKNLIGRDDGVLTLK